MVEAVNKKIGPVSSQHLSVMAHCIRTQRRWFWLALLFVAIESAFEVVIPFLMADIIDIGILGHQSWVFVNRGLWMAACAAGSLLTGLAYAKCAARCAAGIADALRRREYEKILSFSFENIDHFETSSLVTRMSSDIMVLQNTITSGIRPIARGPIMLVLGMIMCFAINVRLSIVFLVVIPFLVAALAWIISKTAPQYRHIQKSVDLLNAAVEENLTAIRLVKSFVREEHEAARFEQINQQLANLNVKTNQFAFLHLPIMQASMYTVSTVLLILGSQMIAAGTMQAGELTGVLSYVLQIMNSFHMMSNVFLLLSRSVASLDRINELLEEKPAMSWPEQGKTMKDGSVVFDHVSFKYSPDAEENVLEDITLDIPSGSKVGIIGATGSAKSSLVSLMDRLYDISQGQLLVGQEKIADLDLHALREGVAMVLQKNTLFSGTIRSNLRWGNAQASDQELIEACKKAGAWEFVSRMEQGLDSAVEQGGNNFSGGQKQRLCIARALLKKPKIMILDDSTSAVDTRTDKLIRDGLASLTDMTQIIVAQRISSVSHCDKIVILDNGSIAAVGTHQQLLESSPIYQEIYESQQGGQSHEDSQ